MAITIMMMMMAMMAMTVRAVMMPAMAMTTMMVTMVMAVVVVNQVAPWRRGPKIVSYSRFLLSAPWTKELWTEGHIPRTADLKLLTLEPRTKGRGGPRT